MGKAKYVGVSCEMKTTLKTAGLELFRPDQGPNEVGLIFNIGLAPPKLRIAVPARMRSRVLNKDLVFDKFAQMQLLKEAGVPVPTSQRARPTGAVDWIMKPHHSHCGIGIRECMIGHQAGTGCYYQKKIDKFQEFRAHVAMWLDNPCFTIQEKKPKRSDMDGYQADATGRLCWNLANGWWYTRVTTLENRAERRRNSWRVRKVEDLAVRAVRVLGYDFGAVDIVMDRDRNLYVLEVNSHPGLKGPSVDIYKKVFKVLVTDAEEGILG